MDDLGKEIADEEIAVAVDGADRASLGARTGRVKHAVLALAVVVAVLVGAGAWYVNDYYHADDAALAAAADADGKADGVTVVELSGSAIAFVPEDPVAGLIFYPGAKVQPEAYAALLTECARDNIVCVLIKPLFNLAILDVDAADGIREQFPDVQTWALAGHSMGGVAASDYLAKREGEFAAVAFLASYPSADLSGHNVRALSIVGSEYGVLNRSSYEDAKAKLPAASEELVIAGGNHAHFGNYGEQAGDGVASITREEQQSQTAVAIEAFIAGRA